MNIARESKDKPAPAMNKIKEGRRFLGMMDFANFLILSSGIFSIFFAMAERLRFLLLGLDMISPIRSGIADSISVRSMRLTKTP